MRRAVLVTAGVLLAVAAINNHQEQQEKARAAEARKAVYQAQVQQCLDEGRYDWQPTYEPEDYLQVYPTGSVSPFWQCAVDVHLQLNNQ